MKYPLGAIIHYTAGRCATDKDAEESFNFLKANGMKAVVIAQSGKIFFPEKWDKVPGPHAGRSFYDGLGYNVSQYCVGFELACEGKLELKDEKFYSWFGTVVPKERVNSFPYHTKNIQKGYYASFSSAQIEQLVKLLFELKKYSSFSFEYVIGHDEVAIPRGRKSDPGGSLGMTMYEFRNYLIRSYAQMTKP